MDKAMIQITGCLWSQSWQIALLVAAVTVATWALRGRSAHVRYLLWLLVVAKCVVPPLFGIAVPILPQDRPAAVAVPMGESNSIAAAPDAFPEGEMVVAQEPAGPLGDGHPAFSLMPAISRREAMALLWLAGLAAFLAAASIKAGRTIRWLAKERTALPATLQSDIRELLSSLGIPRMPGVWLVENGSQPFVWGLWRGAIYLPSSFAAMSNFEHRRDILAHELSHVLRLDAAVNLLQIVAQAIFWFHPLVWWANAKVRQEREKCCDEMAIARLGATPRSYSRAIVEALLAEHKSNGLMPSLAIAGPAKNIEERIKTMLRPGRRFYRRPSLPTVTCALVLALLLVPTTLALTNRPADKTGTQEAAAGLAADQIEQQRTTSAEKLKKFVLRLAMHADEHEGRYPHRDEISWVSEEDPNTFDIFLLEKVEYLGTGKTRPETNAFAMPLAFDIPLLRTAGGTNVAFADGHVEFITTDKLAARGVTIRKVNLAVTVVRFEPIHQGKNVVHVLVNNTSNEEQVFAAHIYTRSPDYGTPTPDPNHGGVGWGTSGYFNTLKPKEAREVRLVFKIQGPVTDRTYVNLRFSNPESEKTYDGKWYFYYRKYMSAELPKAKANEVVQERASPAEAQAITRAFTEIQRYIQDGQYEQAWERFSKDYQWAEYQRLGFEQFRRTMEPTHPMHSAFWWERGDFLKLTPGQVLKRNGVLALAAGFEGQTWTIDFVRQDNQWKIDWIAGYTPGVLKIQEQERQPPAPETKGNLQVVDIQFDPIRLAKNEVRIAVRNNTSRDQTFGIDIRVESSLQNWQRQLVRTVKGSTTERMSFDFEVPGPITDGGSIRLRFHNPASAEAFDVDKWFEQRNYPGEQLDLHESLRGATGPVSEAEKQAVIAAFEAFRGPIREQKFDAAWGLVSQHLRSRFGDDVRKFTAQMGSGEGGSIFLSLTPDAVTRMGPLMTLNARHEYQAWKVHFIQEDGQWKIYQGQVDTKNWEDRLLPMMEKQTAAHFDIYYFKDSTAAREIDHLAKQKDAGFEQICRFLGSDSNIRIRMVLFEDGRTKQQATGHQGAGWAYGSTIVEIYNEKEKSDPYHETTHILMGPFGGPPALFNEGFAVYMSERLGTRAMEGFGGGQATIHQHAKELKSKGEWIELPELLGYTEIGPGWSRPPIAYPEAASFVKFLIDTYGRDKFLQAYKTIRNSNEESGRAENIQKLEEICGKPLQTLQQQWEAVLARS